MGAQPGSRESLLSPKQDQGFWLSSSTGSLTPVLCRPRCWGLETAGPSGAANCKRTLIFLAPTTKGCNVENPFILIFCQLLGSALCNLLTWHFSSWLVLLKPQVSAGTHVPVPNRGLPAGRSSISIT